MMNEKGLFSYKNKFIKIIVGRIEVLMIALAFATR